MTSLYLMRHGHPVNGHPLDGTRALDAKGEQQSEDMAKWLTNLIGRVDIVIHSPMKRAVQTAEKMGAALGAHLASTTMLQPDARPVAAEDEITRLAQQSKDVLVVGHDPSLNELLKHLTGDSGEAPGPRFEHCSIAYLKSQPGGGLRLMWLVTPDLVINRDLAEVEEAALAFADELSVELHA